MDETFGSTHDLLLAVAGRVDDDLLAWARELVAVGEDTRAVELVAAGLAADGTALPVELRARLVDAARAARIDLDADAALPTADEPEQAHRFTAAPTGGDHRVTDAVRALPARLLEGAEVLLAWRTTPAGAAPGPLPHPVVLVEVERGGRPADVLAYQLSVALDRAGVVASVEVLTSGDPLPDYHVAARRDSLRIDGSPDATSTIQRAVPEPDPAETSAPEPRESEYADLWASEPTFVAPAEPDATATDPTGVAVTGLMPTPRPLPLRPTRNVEPSDRQASGSEPEPRPFERRRTTVTPLTRSSTPSSAPPTRRDGSRLRPLAPVTDETPDPDDMAPEATDPQLPGRPGGDAYSSLADTPTFRSMQDPLSGPLNAPLLAPLLDPTPHGEQGTSDHDDDPFGIHGVSPLAPDVQAPAPGEDRWAGEWASGEWAVSPSDLDRDPEPEPVTAHSEPEAEDDAPRHRFLAEEPPSAPRVPAPLPQLPARLPPEPRPDRPTAGPPRPGPGRPVARPAAAAQRPEQARQVPVAEGPAPDPEALGLRPDSVARLSDADRDLLARLQSELGAGSRARISRRAGMAPNGSRPSGNGSGHGNPPDLAG